MVTLGTAACADTLPSPSFAVAVWTAVAVWAGAVGLDCLSPPQPKSASVTAQSTDNRPAVLFMIGLFVCTRVSVSGDYWAGRPGAVTAVTQLYAASRARWRGNGSLAATR